ncbi:MAG: C-type lectin domain-containing protein [Planctomycetota bacterium]
MKRRRTLAFACMSVAFLVASAEAGLTQWAVNGHYYENVEAPGIGRNAAKAAADAAGGYLMTVTSESENDFIFNNILVPNPAYVADPTDRAATLQNSYWTGGVYNEAAGLWEWYNGEAWIYDGLFFSGLDKNGSDIQDTEDFYEPDPVVRPGYLMPVTETIDAPYVRMSAGSGGWSDHPEDGNLMAWRTVDMSTVPPSPTYSDFGPFSYIYGYVIEYDSNPVPAPGALLLGSIGVFLTRALRRRSAI